MSSQVWLKYAADGKLFAGRILQASPLSRCEISFHTGELPSVRSPQNPAEVPEKATHLIGNRIGVRHPP
jgi:hypothetical protein